MQEEMLSLRRLGNESFNLNKKNGAQIAEVIQPSDPKGCVAHNFDRLTLANSTVLSQAYSLSGNSQMEKYAEDRVSFNDLIMPEILEKILGFVDVSDYARIHLSICNKELHGNSVVHAHAIETIGAYLFSHSEPSLNEIVESSTNYMIRLKELVPDFQMRSISALLKNPRSNHMALTLLIIDHLSALQVSENNLDLSRLLDLQVKARLRLPSEIRTLAIINALPSSHGLAHLIETEAVNPAILIRSLIESIGYVEHNDDLKYIFGKLKFLVARTPDKNASVLSRDMVNVSLKCEDWHAAALTDCAIDLLPKILQHDTHSGSIKYLNDIDLLFQSVLSLERGYQSTCFNSIISNFTLVKAKYHIHEMFSHAIEYAWRLNADEMELAMLGIHKALKECDLLNNHGLCYKNAKTVQLIPERAYHNGHREIAHTLPLFNKKQITSRSVADLLENPLYGNERDGFLRAIGPYFRSGLCPYRIIMDRLYQPHHRPIN